MTPLDSDRTQLHTIVFLIQSALSDQFLMRAAFPDTVRIQNYDLIGSQDGRQPVGYRDRRATVRKLFKPVLYETFTLIVQSTCRLIKYQDRRVL